MLGTTTDPVQKAMELLPLGPVVMIDTPGLDDEGELGELRIKKAYQMLNKSDIALLVIDGSIGPTNEDLRMLARIRDKKIPYVVVLSKGDIASNREAVTASVMEQESDTANIMWVSAEDRTNINELKERIAALAPEEDPDRESSEISLDLMIW